MMRGGPRALPTASKLRKDSRGPRQLALRTLRKGWSGMPQHGRILVALFLTAALTVSGRGLAQDSVEKFYAGKTVRLVVGYPPASTFDTYARAIARFLPQYIPGNPNLIVQNMPGAGSLTATGFIANVAPRDGTVIAMINPVNTTEPLLDPERAKFDPRKFGWIGSMNREISTCAFWTNKIASIDDLRTKEAVLGSTGPSSGSTVDAKTLESVFGFKLRLVTGYPGLTEVRLAAERGEVDGHCGMLVSALKTDVWDDLQKGRIKVPLQMAVAKHPDLPNVPNVFDIATSEKDRNLLKLVFGPWSFGRPLVAPPEVPQDRLKALRAAVQATLADPQFQADAKRINLEIQPVGADAIAKTLEDLYRTPEPVLQRARVMLGVNAR
jgi:tripartite-type tricarboxylate transporter receptor subunit TctC